MICYLRSSLVSEDVRLSKYIAACAQRKVAYTIVSWDREGSSGYVDREYPFKKKAPYGRLWKNLFPKLMWQFYLLYKLFVFRKQYRVIHACDFDTMLPAVIMSILLRKKVVYDIYDAFSKRNPKGIRDTTIRRIDRAFMRKADVIILADILRAEQMEIDKDVVDHKVFVVENVPHIDRPHVAVEPREDDGHIHLAYVGVLDRFRGIEDLLEVVTQNERFTLEVAGLGTLNDVVRDSAVRCPRITYRGFVDYTEGLGIMSSADFIIGMYYPVNDNHIYAAPNKFYEALALGKPLITSKGTIVADKVAKYHTGITVSADRKGLTEELATLDKDDERYGMMCTNASSLWQQRYKTYFAHHLCGAYIDRMMMMGEKQG